MYYKVLPEGWIEGKLGELVKVSSGVGFPKKFQGKSIGDYPVYKVGDVSKAVTTNTGYLDTAGHYVDKAEATELKGAIFPIGSTLFAKIGEAVKLNRRAFVLEPGLADNNVMAVLPDTKESNRFIYSFMRTVDLNDISRSTTVPSIRKGDIEEIVLAIPPLAEQKVIADKLDTLLAQVETSKARLERIPQILKTFRQSVLAAAVSGKLTEEWRGDNKASSTPTRLKAITAIAGGKTPSKSNSSYWESGDILWVSPKDMKVDLIADSQDKITKEAIDSGGMKLVPSNSILVVTRSGILAHSFPVAKTSVPVTINQDIKALVPNLGFISPEFLFYLLKGLERRILDECTKAGTTVSSVETSLLMNLEFELPSLEEQTEIVRRVEELFAFADRIEQKANAALERVNNLTQSILAKAFRGELTADWRAANPDLITGENSAEALLKKIKAEREALKKQPKTKSTVKKKTGSRMSKQIIKVVDALKEAGKPLKGQQLLAAAGYPSDSSTDLLEQFFLDIRGALTAEKSIVKLERSDDGQDWFALAGTAETNKA
ncbi:restriction endonuclease subunit S [Vibrio cholerae]|nr:restriction endonuclease subunit S [Vibrio cholerae]EIA4708870.1 restriction endonuclease subunit S [Vibrio cholerae]EJL6416699.1 restriction endonuclease subunit S [Vibrio cholerae]EJL6452654.1 restriction endonuclease subunit S [Vibrio cholerae]EJL6669399.1 restriction endonuclease subunit S [Vibrio cholerae]